MKLAILAGFAVGTAIVLAVFIRELSDNAEKMRAVRLQERARQQEQAETDWRRFLAKWEAA